MMSEHNARGTQEDRESINVEESKDPTVPIESPGCSKKKSETFDNVEPSTKTDMGSTDSAGGGHSGGTSCGLMTSLFSTSCRGRAESFACHLHRRLASLGGETRRSDDDGPSSANAPTETTWLQKSAGQRTTTTAPCNSANSLTSSLQTDERVIDVDTRKNSDNDVYYDLSTDPEDREKRGIGSPAEIANAEEVAKIVVNPRLSELANRISECRRPTTCLRTSDDFDPSMDSEFDCVFSSPTAGTSPEGDCSDAFYDPESSETERSRTETFFDPRGTSDGSDGVSDEPNGSGITKVLKFFARSRSNREEDETTATERTDDESESSASFGDRETMEGSGKTGFGVACSSEESANGRSSLETTSPSHESLWSTFDESTVSLQDDGTAVTRPDDFSGPSGKLSKSHSDSEIIGNSSATVENRDVVDFVVTENSTVKKIDVATVYDENSTIPVFVDCPRFDESMKIASDERSATAEMASTVDRRSENLRENGEASTRTDNLRRILDIETKVDKKDDDDGKSEDSDDDTRNDEPNENELEEEDDRPGRLRRCSSLKTGKTPPGTPGRKKIVRFADVLGLDLADVRTFLDEIPKIPNSAYSDLIYDQGFQKDSSPVNFWGTGPATFTTPLVAATMGQRGSVSAVKHEKILIPLFQQPGGLLNFLDLVRVRNVCLENVVVHDPSTMCLRGTVRVRNLDFHKSVHVRYSLDSWKNFSDLQAAYASNSCDGFSDKFTFSLYCHTLKVGQRLEMAVRFQCKGAQYWDNNAGVNYCFQCLPATPANPGSYVPSTAPTNGGWKNHDWSPAFY